MCYWWLLYFRKNFLHLIFLHWNISVGHGAAHKGWTHEMFVVDRYFLCCIFVVALLQKKHFSNEKFPKYATAALCLEQSQLFPPPLSSVFFLFCFLLFLWLQNGIAIPVRRNGQRLSLPLLAKLSSSVMEDRKSQAGPNTTSPCHSGISPTASNHESLKRDLSSQDEHLVKFSLDALQEEDTEV